MNQKYLAEMWAGWAKQKTAEIAEIFNQKNGFSLNMYQESAIDFIAAQRSKIDRQALNELDSEDYKIYLKLAYNK